MRSRCSASRARSLTPLDSAASDTAGEEVLFHANTVYRDLSGLRVNRGVDPRGDAPPDLVRTIDRKRLVAYGVPRDLKIDIEDQETAFLSGMAGSDRLPEFVSVECHTLAPVGALFSLGIPPLPADRSGRADGLRPAGQGSARAEASPNFRHASGPFGLDVFIDDDGCGFERFRTDRQEAQPTRIRTWCGCHARQPAFASGAARGSPLDRLREWATRRRRPTPA